MKETTMYYVVDACANCGDPQITRFGARINRGVYIDAAPCDKCGGTHPRYTLGSLRELALYD